MKKIIASLLLSSLLLTSCGKTPETPAPTTSKTPYEVEILHLAHTGASYTVDKTARLTPASSITVASDGIGQVTAVLVKEGQSVKKGQILVQMKDTLASYDLAMKQANNTIANTAASRETTLVALDRAIADATIARSQAVRTRETLEKDVIERKKQADNDYTQSRLSSGTTSDLSLQKLQIDLTKAENDLSNQTMNLDSNYQLFLSALEQLMTQALHEGDKILGITTNYEYANDSWEWQLGVRIGNVKSQANNDWNTLYGLRGELRSLKEKNTKMTVENANSLLSTLQKGYSGLAQYDSTMILMLQNSAVGGGLSQIMLDGWVTLFSGLKTGAQSSESGFTSWKNGISTLITRNNGKSVAEMNIESIRLQIESSEKSIKNGVNTAAVGYARTVIGLEDQLRAADLSLQQAENTLRVAEKNKQTTLAQLSVGALGAQISREQAEKNLEKLTIRAPVNGKVTRVTAVIGQSMNTGSPAIEIASTTPEILVDVDYSVMSSLSLGDQVSVIAGEQQLTGSIIALSRIANASLLYTTRITIPRGAESLDLLGQVVAVRFVVEPSSTPLITGGGLTLPLSTVKIISEQEGEITLLGSGNTLSYKSVSLGRLRGSQIEILDPLDPSLQIILTNMESYDKMKHEIVLKKKD